MIKFSRDKFSGLDGRTKVRYQAEDAVDFYIDGDEVGVTLKGQLTLYEAQDFEDLAKAIGNAANEHLKLKPKLTKDIIT